ncbi:MAG: hypothetical protein ACK56L_23440 [Pseudanabaena sp.]
MHLENSGTTVNLLIEISDVFMGLWNQFSNISMTVRKPSLSEVHRSI